MVSVKDDAIFFTANNTSFREEYVKQYALLFRAVHVCCAYWIL
jgi:hypothetical protein